MLFLPQTPQYLMMCKKDSKAEALTKKLKLSTNVRQTMADIRISLTEESSDRLCQSENNMNGRMFIGIGLVMAQQLTGTVKPRILRPRRSRTPLIHGLRLLYNSFPHLVVYYNPAKL